jgi:lipid A 3-O-deacylase
MGFRAGYLRRAAMLAAALTVAAPTGQAQTPPAAPKPTPASTASTWTLQDENASVSSGKLTDRYYVNGLRLGWTSAPDSVPGFLTGVGQAVWGSDGQLRFGFNLSQQIFTPADTASTNPPSNDRPYAGVLLGTFALQRDVPDSRSTLSLGLGVVGPWALGEQVQNGFHDVIGQGHTNGWHAQLHNEPAVQLTSARTWRLPTGTLGGLETDALPDLAVGLGNVRIYAQTGAVFRIGEGLDSDYGVARVAYGPSGGDTFTPTRPFAWYVFAGADGQAVAHDITLDGNSFRDSPNVKLQPFVGEFEAGLAVMAFGARLTYTHVLQTQDFKNQKGGLHQLGSLALSVRF